jgi:hypothetical protein
LLPNEIIPRGSSSIGVRTSPSQDDRIRQYAAEEQSVPGPVACRAQDNCLRDGGGGLAIAAVLSGIEYLMVWGICNYGDEMKDETWQTYASAIAASFALSIIESL